MTVSNQGITREDALSEMEFHANGGCTIEIGPRGGITKTMEVWRVNGRAHTWIRNENVRVPVKFGFRGTYSYVLWPAEASCWHTREACPVIRAFQTGCGPGARHHLECTSRVCMVAYREAINALGYWS